MYVYIEYFCRWVMCIFGINGWNAAFNLFLTVLPYCNPQSLLYFDPNGLLQSIALSIFVCLSVRIMQRHENHTAEHHLIFVIRLGTNQMVSAVRASNNAHICESSQRTASAFIASPSPIFYSWCTHRSQTHECPHIAPTLTVLRYVMNFRFRG